MNIIEFMRKCTGCEACVNICPKNALEMKMRNSGFYYPELNEDICVNCGLCKNVCPINKDYNTNNNASPNIYAFSSSDDILSNSSSGGAFSVLAEYVLKNNGVVAGAIIDESLDVHHEIIDTIERIDELRRSKYVQSRNLGCYKKIKDYLNNGKTVLYSGCPCQIAGLRGYLGIEYSNLYTIDLICHGIPSPGIFKKHVTDTYGNNVKTIEFREREKWTSCFNVIYNNGEVEYHDTKHEIFQIAFHHDLILRKSCYNCKYSTLPRVGDVTIGDFWGVKKFGLGKPYNKKCSIVLTNNEHGEALWKASYDSFEHGKYLTDLTEKAEITNLNKNIYTSIVTNENKRIKFFKEYNGMNFENAAYFADSNYNVGLLLFFSDNYGSCATNYALYKVIEELGYTPLVLDNLIGPSGISARFAKKHMKLSSAFMEKDDYEHLNSFIQSYVVGSDQSLRWDFGRVLAHYQYMLMAFVPDSKRKIGYACSFGPDRRMLDNNIKNYYTDTLKRFTDFSVREDYAVDMCKNNFNITPEWVIDPVFLVDKKYYQELAAQSNKNLDHPYLLAYIRYASEEKKTLINEICKKNSLKPIIICDASNYDVLKKQLGDIDIIDKPEFIDWLYYFSNASFVITDSFHGTCFSIIFEKEYISIKAGTTQRFTSLANLLGYSENHSNARIYDNDKMVLDMQTMPPLDYRNINCKIDAEVNRCREWLLSALSRKIESDNNKCADELVNYGKLLTEYVRLKQEN